MKSRAFEGRVSAIINDIERRLSNLEKRVSKIPDPFTLYYRAPENEGYQKIDEVLDHIHIRLNMLED